MSQTYLYCPDGSGDTYDECEGYGNCEEGHRPGDQRHCAVCTRNIEEHESSFERRPNLHATGVPLPLDDPRRKAKQ